MKNVRLLHRDDHVVAVHKPAGLLVHRSNLDRHETRFALQQVRDLIGRRVYPVHRLDKPTSGVLVMALDPETARLLSEEFTGRRVDKRYLAVVRGVTEHEGRIDYPLVEKADPKTDGQVRRDKPARPAVTDYRRLASAELPVAVNRYPTSRYALVELAPRTGRRHQIRRHLKHIFHPVIGDTTHGDGRHNRFFRETFGCRRLLLACTRVAFDHPRTGAHTVIQAEPEDDFLMVVRSLGWGAGDA